MKTLHKITGFLPYFLIIFLNTTVDLGHKIILQNTIFKASDGAELMILTAVINALILLPFILLFAPAGFISDRYAKTHVIQISSFIAIIITIFITIFYYLGQFEMAFIATLILAAQSAFYSPAKYGLIKEMFGIEHITKANAITQSITIVAILLGAVIYSIFFESLLPNNITDKAQILQFIAPIGFVLIASSIVEFILSKQLPVTKKSKINQRFNIKKYLTGTYLKDDNILIKHKPIIWYSVLGLSIFWAVSQIVVAVFGAFLKSSAGVENTIIAQSLLAIGGVGTIIGSIIASKISKNYIETGVVPLGGIGIAITLFIMPNCTEVNIIAAIFFIYGICAGLIIVPLNSLIQFNASELHLGRILATNNLYQNLMMLLALIATVLLSYLQFDSRTILFITGIIATFATIWAFVKLPQSLIIYLVRFVFKTRYKIITSGIENIPMDSNKGVLLLGNHVSYIDWAILQIIYPKQIRFVMEKSIYKRWYLKWFFDFFNIVPISPGGSKNALKTIANALNQGDTVALFPEGMLSKNGTMSPFLSGFELALKDVINTVVIPFYLHGLWGNRFSQAQQRNQKNNNKIYIKFGKQLSTEITANELQNIIINLGLDSWHKSTEQEKNISHNWIDSVKTNKQFFIADSTGMNLKAPKILTATLMMRQWLKKPLNKQQNIGIILPATAAGSMCNMALFCLGKTVCNLNYTTGINSLKYAIKQADIKTIITSRKFVQKLKNKGFDLSEIINTHTNIYLEKMQPFATKVRALSYLLRVLFYPKWLLKLQFASSETIHDTAAILFSSGSEDVPKGIMLSHKNLIANVKQVNTLLNPSSDDKIMGTLPIFHSFGFTVCTLLPQLEGIPVIYHPDPTDGFAIGKLVSEFKATVLLGTATFFRLYLRNNKLHPLMLQSIRLTIAGAEKLSNDIFVGFKQKFGLDILEGYGVTETSPVVSCNTPNILLSDVWIAQQWHKCGTVGKPLVGTKVIITDPKTFKKLPTGKSGMILITGPQVMNGYLNNPDKTSEVIKIIDGYRYYVTGDKGMIDSDGFLSIVDRYSRFAKIAGEMISLGSCEEQIRNCLGDTIELSVTNIPDIKKGEKLVLLFSGEITKKIIKQKLIDAKINPLYLPTTYHKVDNLPKLGTGKVDFAGIKKLAISLECC